jgi:hypothetical protein
MEAAEALCSAAKTIIGQTFGAAVNGQPRSHSEYGEIYLRARVFLPGATLPDADGLALAMLVAMDCHEPQPDLAIVWRRPPYLVYQPEIPAGERLDFNTHAVRDMPRQPEGWYASVRYHLHPKGSL